MTVLYVISPTRSLASFFKRSSYPARILESVSSLDFKILSRGISRLRAPACWNASKGFFILCSDVLFYLFVNGMISFEGGDRFTGTGTISHREGLQKVVPLLVVPLKDLFGSFLDQIYLKGVIPCLALFLGEVGVLPLKAMGKDVGHDQPDVLEINLILL